MNFSEGGDNKGNDKVNKLLPDEIILKKNKNAMSKMRDPVIQKAIPILIKDSLNLFKLAIKNKKTAKTKWKKYGFCRTCGKRNTSYHRIKECSINNPLRKDLND